MSRLQIELLFLSLHFHLIFMFMDIKAVKFRKDGFYTQPFAFGGEEGPRCKQGKEKFNKA